MFFYAVVYGSTTRLFGSTYDIEYKSNGTLEFIRENFNWFPADGECIFNSQYLITHLDNCVLNV